MFTLWFTGLPCSGKSTLAGRVVEELTRRRLPVELLDGDDIRRQYRTGLGFSKQDRDEHVRRIAFGCRLLNSHDIAAVVAVISPYRNIRDEARSSIANFIEVHVKASLETCIKRDVKGLYKKALAGEIADFTGIAAPYEPPLRPDLVADTEHESPASCVAKILAGLEALGLIQPASEPVSSVVAVSAATERTRKRLLRRALLRRAPADLQS